MMPDGSNGVQRKRQVYCRSYTAMVEGRPRSLPGPFSCGKDRSFLSYTAGKAMAAQASPNSIHLSPMREGKIEWKDDMDSNKPIPIRAGRSPYSRDYVLQ